VSYDIEVREVDPQLMVSIRTTCQAAEIAAVLQEILPEVYKFLERLGVKPSGPPFTRFHGFDQNRVDLESGLPVSESVEGKGRIEPGELPGGTVVTTMHVGPYEKLPEAHDALHVWMRKKNKTPSGPQWEYYWTDPGEEPDPSKRRTELIWPIREA